MQENSSRHPVVPLAMQRQLTPNLLEAIRPYQVMYDQIMLRLEQLMHTITPRQMGRTATQQALLAEANEVRTQAEAAVGISRERYGRIQEYPMTPAEAFPSGQYIMGVDPARPDTDSEGVFSVWRRSMEERHEAAQRQGQTLQQMMEEAFYQMPQPRERQIVIHTSEAGARIWEEAVRQFAEETERAMWYGSSTPRKTRRDKKVVVSTSIYWEYQPFD